MEENNYFRGEMKKMKPYLLLTTVLLFAMSSVLGFCGIGGAVAEISSALEKETVATICTSAETNVSEEMFRMASASWTAPGTISCSAPVSRICVRLPHIHVDEDGLLTHFTHHKYFIRSALPFIFKPEPSVCRHYLQFLRVLII